ncbi:hypothetical protein F0L68_35700 [Solihabitans fulvus]|uniref:Uncharacterized protein n=1 Tax=Solihabitans fulvus TaxID=1892852 RepID=A0A5B2WLU4_9PSEU|nr:hypothetical protein [Solihabitans fulvus]KAA2252395.1 hypothetical protein F0L68_35700 [Solihabitans fulvus]
MPLLVTVGVAELTVAVLSGWLMVLVVRAPAVLRRAGVRQLKRIRQAHLDLVMMGVIQVAVGAAVQPMAGWIAALIAFGAIAQPLGFLPLALRPQLVRAPAFQVLAAVVFTATTVGWVALAVRVIT